ncbi:DUF4123 domain-containing protein [Salmonella enterica subsp. enterica]|nr:DUF4123 domain-containing protein [Salmonella enterica subsp. enterica]EDV4378763.1 DUF4123 domain-containing protein [Salmonella enterica subsp. enterica]
MPDLPDESSDGWRYFYHKGKFMNSISFNHAVKHLIHSSEVALFALVDGLQYERFFYEELTIQQDISMPLFEEYPDSRIAFAGPWVIKISGNTNIREKLIELEKTFPSVSWLVSTSSLAELTIHFQKYINITLPNKQIALLRIQDPQVQVRLGKILNEDQHKGLTCLMEGWTATVENMAYSLKLKKFIY